MRSLLRKFIAWIGGADLAILLSVLIVVLSRPVLGTRLVFGQVAGVVCAVVALALLVAGLQELAAEGFGGVAATLIAAAMHAFAYVMIKKHGGPIHTLTLNTLPIIISGLLLTGASLIVDRPGAEVFTTRSVLATIHLGIVASVVGLVVYFWLLQRLSAVTASFVFVIFPLVAQLVSVTVEQAPFGLRELALTLVIIGAFAWTQLAGRPRATAPEITEDQLAEIFVHADRRYPAECCGYVSPSGVRACANVVADVAASDRTSHTGFAFGPRDLLALSRSFDTDDAAFVIYHSHPDAGAYFSEEDARFAVVEGAPVYPVDHLVVDVSDDGVHGARLYRFDPESGAYRERDTYGTPRSRAQGLLQ